MHSPASAVALLTGDVRTNSSSTAFRPYTWTRRSSGAVKIEHGAPVFDTTHRCQSRSVISAMSLSRSDGSDTRQLSSVAVSRERVAVVSDDLVFTASRRKLMKRAARHVAVSNVRVSKSAGWWANHHRCPCVCWLGGCLALIKLTSVEIMAVFAPTILTIRSEAGNTRVVVATTALPKPVCAESAIASVTHSAVRNRKCRYSPRWQDLFAEASQNKLWLWTRPVDENLSISVFQRRCDNVLVCPACSKLFARFSEWQEHIDDVDAGPDRYSVAILNGAGDPSLARGTMNFSGHASPTGFRHANMYDVASKLQTLL